MRKKVAIRCLTALALFAGASYLATQGLVWHYPGKMDFFLNNRQYQAIAAEVEAAPPAVGQDKIYRVAGADMARHICAAKEPDGRVLISFATLESRADTYGYLYSDRPFMSHELEGELMSASCAEPWRVLKRINEHWVVVHANS